MNVHSLVTHECLPKNVHITPFLLMIFKNLKQNKPASFSVWHSHSILVGTVYDALQREKFSFMMNFILLNCIMDDA